MKKIRTWFAFLFVLTAIFALALNTSAVELDGDGEFAPLHDQEFTLTLTPSDLTEMPAAPNAAKSGTWGDLKWSVSGTTLTISGSGTMDEVFFDEYPWHAHRNTITKVVVKDGVINVGQDAFALMPKLTTVSLGKNVEFIGNEAFYGNTNMTTVNFPNILWGIDSYAFAESGLTKASFPYGLLAIGEYTFYKCPLTGKIRLPGTVELVLDYAFAYTHLTDVEYIANAPIPANCFYECRQLKTVTMGKNVSAVGVSAFYYAVGLQKVEIGSSVTEIGSHAFQHCTALTDLVMSDSVKSIGEYAFARTGIQELTLVNAELGTHAFSNCTSLHTVHTKKAHIEDYTFYCCTSLKTVHAITPIRSIGKYAFEKCSSLTSFPFGSQLVSIGDQAFRYSGLKEVTLPDTLTSLGSSAFYSCTKLNSVTFGNGLSKIPDSAFSGCTQLATIKMSDSITSISNHAFYGAKALTTLNMGKNVKSIGVDAFSRCSELTTINWSGKETEIGDCAFSNSNKLYSVTIPGSVTTFYSGVFNACPNLKIIVIPETVATLNMNRFLSDNMATLKIYNPDLEFVDPNLYGSSSPDTLTIYGWPGSTAETYAASCGIDFQPLGTLTVPEKPYKIVNVVSGVHVYWTETKGADKYGLWRSETGKDGTYKWIANPTVPHFTDTKVESGKTYFYKVTSMDSVLNLHSEKSEPIGIAFVSTPDITSRSNIAAGVALGWEKIEGATGYAIYRKTYSGTDAWARIATIEGSDTLSWTDTSVKNSNGEAYKYTIRALYGTTLSGCRNAGRTMVRLSSQYIKSIEAPDSNSVKLSWSTSSRVTGYEVRFMIGDQVYKTFTIGNYKTGVKTFTGLPAGQTYTVQVRTYKKVDGVGSFYSDWSTAKTVKT